MYDADRRGLKALSLAPDLFGYAGERISFMKDALGYERGLLHLHPKLVLIEGLPGSGKSTTAQLVHELLTGRGVAARLYQEGNPEHPADYEGAAWFDPQAFEQFLQTHGQHHDFLTRHARQHSGGCLLEYRKLHEGTTGFPDDLLAAVSARDIYELPFEQNRRLIADRWRGFAKRAMEGSDTYVFECCFIQNPVTVGMIKYGADSAEVMSYVFELASIVEPLNPLLIYVDQDDLDRSFRKAVAERPKEWADGFMAYYTGQGFGKKHGYEGVEGTIRILEARHRLEAEIYANIDFSKRKVNNSLFDRQAYKQELSAILEEHF